MASQRADVAGHVERDGRTARRPSRRRRCARIRWAELDTGRNSVSPCTMPSSAAWRSSTRAGSAAYDDPHVAAAALRRGRSTASSTGTARAAGRGLAAAEDDGDRRGDEHRRVGAADDRRRSSRRRTRAALRRRTDTAPAPRGTSSPDVMIVRPSVWLTLRFTTLSSGSRRSSRAFSRTRSKMTIVSFTE